MAQQLQSGPMNIQHGHTDTQVVIKFSRVTDHLLLTPAQVEDFFAAVRNSLAQLSAHQASGGKLSRDG